MFSALLLRYTVNNRPRFVCNPYFFLSILKCFVYHFLITVPPAEVDAWKTIHNKVARDCMLPPSWGGEKLGGKENAGSLDQSIGTVGTVVQMLLTWNDFERALTKYAICLFSNENDRTASARELPVICVGICMLILRPLMIGMIPCGSLHTGYTSRQNGRY